MVAFVVVIAANENKLLAAADLAKLFKKGPVPGGELAKVDVVDGVAVKNQAIILFLLQTSSSKSTLQCRLPRWRSERTSVRMGFTVAKFQELPVNVLCVIYGDS